MSLRLLQWTKRPGSESLELLRPIALVEVLGDSSHLEWELVDSKEAFELSGGEGTGYIELMDWHRAGRRVPTPDLVQALKMGNGMQLIWGELRAFEPGSSGPVLRISAFDSTWYDIEGRADLLDLIRLAVSKPE